MKLFNYTTPTIEIHSVEQADIICASKEYGIEWDWLDGNEGGFTQ